MVGSAMPEREAMKSTEAQPGIGSGDLLERARNPEIGDRYVRSDGWASLEVTHVSPWMVSVLMIDEDGHVKLLWPIKDWKRMVENTINHGARFEPHCSNSQAKTRRD